MKLKRAIKILEDHNKWRRGAEIEMQEPKVIGIALDTVISKTKQIMRLVNGNNDKH